ncbi:hypothetical protein TIFTF001_010523 [Ficus carica]|uniref:Uncharacterized protein n=1 Tax=Ficus carica TaxID=3494 RepID=A0AA87ZX53_FICCA|nr:hypothetical protein TIFTF001_010523 [Ficus carica]
MNINGQNHKYLIHRVEQKTVAVEDSGEVGVEVGVEGDDLGDVAVELLDKSDVLAHVVRDPRLVVLVHLLYQRPVPIQHRLHLPEALVEPLPHLRISFLPALLCSGGGAFRQVPAVFHVLDCRLAAAVAGATAVAEAEEE